MLETLATLAISGWAAAGCGLYAGGRDGRRCRGGVRGAILRKLIAAQAACSDPRHQQQAGGHGRGLQTGHVVH